MGALELRSQGIDILRERDDARVSRPVRRARGRCESPARLYHDDILTEFAAAGRQILMVGSYRHHGERFDPLGCPVQTIGAVEHDLMP